MQRKCGYEGKKQHAFFFSASNEVFSSYCAGKKNKNKNKITNTKHTHTQKKKSAYTHRHTHTHKHTHTHTHTHTQLKVLPFSLSTCRIACILANNQLVDQSQIAYMRS